MRNSRDKSPSDLRFEKFATFSKEHGEENFPTKELCSEYMRLKRDWWGSNLVCLGMDDTNGLYSPMFNVWN